MSFASNPRLLRNVLIADAISCVACGALQVLFSREMPAWLGLPGALLVATGWFLVAYGALVGLLASRTEVPHAFVWLIAAGNFGWTVGCAAIMVASWSSLTALGVAWLFAQGATTLVLGELQVLCLRRPGLRISA